MDAPHAEQGARLIAAQSRHGGVDPYVAVSSRQRMYLGASRERRSTSTSGVPSDVPVDIAPDTTLERTVRRMTRFHVDGPSFERWLKKELLRIRPDVVHVHWSSEIGNRAVRAGHEFGVPVVAQVHFDLADVVSARMLGGLGQKSARLTELLRRRFERHLQDADAVVVATENLAVKLAPFTDAEPLVLEDLAPLSVDADWDVAAERLEEIYAKTIARRHTPGRSLDTTEAAPRGRDGRLRPDSDDRPRRIAAATTPDDGVEQIVIIGGGPAGLTAGLDAARRTGLRPIVLEASDALGGLSRTVDFGGNLIDIGGHRFFSKSERVTNWWLDVLPLADGAKWRPEDPVGGPDPHTEHQMMLVRSRRSQILWNGQLFQYPIDVSFDLLRKLGLRRTVRAGFSYLRAQAFPVSPVDNLEDFYVNRFGRELYRTFFESYTEKVWGLPCREISPDWGAQRVKGLSLWAALWHSIKPKRPKDSAQRDVETSLVERFLYPKYGPGQMWETAASNILDEGGDVLTRLVVTGLEFDESPAGGAAGGSTPRITGVRATDRETGDELVLPAAHVVSTLPLNRLVDALGDAVSDNAREIAAGLSFRDFLTVGVLVDNLRLTEPDGSALLDNWIYIQEPDVLVGRLQIFNNWSPWMVADPSRSWIGLEYFCNTTDPMWSWPEDRLVRLAGQELASIGVIEPGGVLDGCAIKVRRAYPTYVGTYDRLDELQPELTAISNLWCAGRNGQHRYNNQDHSMLASMMAIDQIADGVRDPEAIWSVNIDDDYHESG
ncbi:MAG: glycosyltransferase [Ilumatobacter sp.]|uniref:glycosyltransferase n=1 Tax=Ilumatobacter sp. TaxID=1967498 RepID=UPI003C71EEE1